MILDARTADEKLMGGTALSTHVYATAEFTETALWDAGDEIAANLGIALRPLLKAIGSESDEFADAMEKATGKVETYMIGFTQKMLNLFQEELLARLEDVESPSEGR